MAGKKTDLESRQKRELSVKLDLLTDMAETVYMLGMQHGMQLAHETLDRPTKRRKSRAKPKA